MRPLLALLLALAAGIAPAAAAPAKPALELERVVMVMRHGVRPPTRAAATPAGVARDPWPAWPVDWGWLTPHGGEGMTLLGRWDRRVLARRGLLAGTGCPAAGAVRVWADTDERTIKSGETWLSGFAPGCGIENGHLSQGGTDPVFSGVEAGGSDYDGAIAERAVLARLGPGGVAARAAAVRPALEKLQAVLGCCAPPVCQQTCSLPDLPSGLRKTEGRRRPGLTGPLDFGSTAAEAFLLEYAEGKPLSEVGWGRATHADVKAMLVLHPLEFDIVARPPYIASRNAAGLIHEIVDGLGEGAPARLTMLVGHDTNIANLGGVLDAHWTAADYPRDDPPPGGAIGFESLRDARGARFVRAFFRAQSMDQIRNLRPLTAAAPPYFAYLPLPCGTASDKTLCPMDAFVKLITARPAG